MKTKLNLLKFGTFLPIELHIHEFDTKENSISLCSVLEFIQDVLQLDEAKAFMDSNPELKLEEVTCINTPLKTTWEFTFTGTQTNTFNPYLMALEDTYNEEVIEMVRYAPFTILHIINFH